MIRYCIVSPVKEYNQVFKKWLKTVSNFLPKPAEIIVATEDKNFPESAKYKILDSSQEILYVPRNVRDTEVERQYKIANAREHLRRYILEETDFQQVLMLDSDVLIKEQFTPLIMFGIMSLTNANIVINLFRSKETGYPPITLGCMALTRGNLELFDFGVFGGWSEDSCYLLRIANANPSSNVKAVLGKIIKVYHYKDGKVEESEDPDLKLTEIRPRGGNIGT